MITYTKIDRKPANKQNIGVCSIGLTAVVATECHLRIVYVHTSAGQHITTYPAVMTVR